MCFNNKFNYRTIHGGCYWIITKKNKQAENKKHKFFGRLHWIVFQFFIWNIIHNKIVFDTLLEQKKTQCMWVKLNQALNNYGLKPG